MKPETQSFYEQAVRRAVAHIVGHLDEALDLAALARLAALSPFHFHRIFKGMVGETPLELHRRLRMERAALMLSRDQGNVTTVAFSSGYETHEAFSRAFRGFYGVSPSEFRRSSTAADRHCARPWQIEIAARSRIHFRERPLAEDFVSFSTGGEIMNVETKTLPKLRLATVRHVGPYSRISEAFAKLGERAGSAGLLSDPTTAMLAVYHDDPETTAPEELRSDAAIVVSESAVLPENLTEMQLSAGRYACTTHLGPYTSLGDTWARFMGQWLPQSGHRVGDGLAFEIYENNPSNARPEELRTVLYVPLA